MWALKNSLLTHIQTERETDRPTDRQTKAERQWETNRQRVNAVHYLLCICLFYSVTVIQIYCVCWERINILDSPFSSSYRQFLSRGAKECAMHFFTRSGTSASKQNPLRVYLLHIPDKGYSQIKMASQKTRPGRPASFDCPISYVQRIQNPVWTVCGLKDNQCTLCPCRNQVEHVMGGSISSLFVWKERAQHGRNNSLDLSYAMQSE